MLKRAFDIAVSGGALIALIPVFVCLAFLVRFFLGAPVLFRQQRPGLNAMPFEMIKFRTMTNAQDAKGQLLPDEQRLPRFGKWLRSTSLDELPELWNVLKGEMSLVGPRPLLLAYVPLYSPEQFRRHELRPGITGWAQVSGRNALSWEAKFALDVWYVDNRSFFLDLRILVLTVLHILKRDGISAAGETMMPIFTGSTSGLDKV
jgi:lipopolysaccharide/colanic/teichoic acid biosynthesis glycosyltransferase